MLKPFIAAALWTCSLLLPVGEDFQYYKNAVQFLQFVVVVLVFVCFSSVHPAMLPVEMEFPKEIINDLDVKIAQLMSNLCIVQQIFCSEFSLPQSHCGTARACSKRWPAKNKEQFTLCTAVCVIPTLSCRWCSAAHPEMFPTAPPRPICSQGWILLFGLFVLSRTPGCKKWAMQLLSSQVLVHGQQTCLFCAVNRSQQNLFQRLVFFKEQEIGS